MKSISKLLIAISCFCLITTACNTDNEMTTYGGGEGSEVSFVQANYTNIEIPMTTQTIDIEIARSNSKVAQEVTLTSTLQPEFNCPTSVSFAAGQSTATITLNVDFLVIPNVYTGKISIDSVYINENLAISTISVQVAKAYTWVSTGMGEWFDQLALYSDDYTGIVPVEVLKAEGFDRYRILKPYANTKVLEASWPGCVGGPASSIIEFWVKEDGVTIAWDRYWNIGINYDGVDGQDIKAYLPSALSASYAGRDSESKILEDKLFKFVPLYYIDGLGGWPNNTYPCYLSLAGGPDLYTYLFED